MRVTSGRATMSPASSGLLPASHEVKAMSVADKVILNATNNIIQL